MAATSASASASQKQNQQRCVFVGNIPYDTTEEQLIQICEEVGPVVSFRLVTDRETGKPKGYGFCEYKDEETALSARRNLQGYEINGRQLRVDFAENDKNADRSKEQSRVGPGMITNTGVLVDHNIDQPMGVSIAVNAAATMARTLGGAQIGNLLNQFGQQSQQMLGNDPLTLHLAKISRRQLNDVISELKVMATKDKEEACKLLLSMPNLSKAIFQAEIMLGMVTPSVQVGVGPTPTPIHVQPQESIGGLPPLPINNLNYLPHTQIQNPQHMLTSSSTRANNDIDYTNRPLKLARLNDGTEQIVKQEAKQVTQVQLPPEVESALLQQVMNLTPEQLSSLSPDQQQQVIQLQRVLATQHR